MIKETKKDETVRKVKTSKTLKKPENYDTFRNEIAKTFGIKKKKSIILKLINTDGEEIAINDQEDLESFLDEMKEFQFYLEESEANDSPIIKKKPSKEESKSKNKVDEEEEQPKKDDEDKGDDGEDGGDDDDLNLEITDKEIESIIESQFKPIPEGNDDLIEDNPFDKEKYAKDLNAKYSKVMQNFKNTFDGKISKIILENSKVIKSDVSSLLKDYSDNQLNNLEEITKEANGIIDGFSTLIVNTNEMNEVMGNIKDNIAIKPKVNTIIEEDDENKNENGNKGTNKIQIKFEKDNLEKEIELKECKFFNLEGIIVENCGDKAFKNLFFVNESQDKNVVILGNKKSAHKLSLDGVFEPNQKGNHTMSLKIEDPKPNSQYKLCLYVREKTDGPNLSKPLYLTIKVKESEEDIRKKEEERRKNEEEENRRKEEEDRKKKEEEERKKQEEEERKKKEEEDRKKQEEEERKKKEEEERKKKEEEEMKKKEEEENGKKAEDDVIDYQGLDPKEVNDLYDGLDKEFNLSSIMEKNEVIQKIIEEKCDREAMNNWIFDKL